MVQRNGFTPDHKRLEQAPGRSDDLNPFSRGEGDGFSSTTKSGIWSDTGGSSMYRWVASLGGEPDLSRPYAQHPWVYACVSSIGRAASSVPVRLQRPLPNGEYEEVTNAPLYDTLGFPNPLQSRRKFFRSIALSQMLYGETFLILLGNGPDGRLVPLEPVGGSRGMMATIPSPTEIWPVRGDLAEAILDPHTKLPSMWRFNTPGGYVDYPAHSIVQIAEANPYNPLRGMGPMQAAFRTASKDFVIDRYDEALLQNGGSPGGVLSVDGPLTDTDQRAIREAWHEAHSRPESHRKTAVLPKGTKYQEIGLSPQAMEHKDLREWDRQTILSIFGVPPVVLGLETQNYATAREQHRIFWETSILPYLEFLADELQHKLVSRIQGPEAELLVDFDISGVSALREDVDSKVDRTIKLYKDGHRSFLEAAHLAGWDISEEDLEGSDERWVPSTLVPASIGSMASEEEGVYPEEEEEERSYSEEAPQDDLTDENEKGWPLFADTEEKRIEYWKTYTAQEDVVIEKVTKKSARVLRDQCLFVRKRLKEIAQQAPIRSADTETRAIPTEAELERLIQLNLEEWGARLADSISPALKDSMVSAAGGLAFEIQAPALITSVTNPFVVDFYASYDVYLAEGVNSNLAKDLRKTILKYMLEADIGGTATLAEAVRVALKEANAAVDHVLGGIHARADRIARTETIKANNGARMAEMQRHNIERHKWLSSQDGKVRATHNISGETTIVGTPFSNGVTFPGDQADRAEEVVNCRCTTLAVLPENPYEDI
jgi:phage portal protein BeeE